MLIQHIIDTSYIIDRYIYIYTSHVISLPPFNSESLQRAQENNANNGGTGENGGKNKRKASGHGDGLWRCQNGCNKVLKSTSWLSIREHKAKCDAFVNRVQSGNLDTPHERYTTKSKTKSSSSSSSSAHTAVVTSSNQHSNNPNNSPSNSNNPIGEGSENDYLYDQDYEGSGNYHIGEGREGSENEYYDDDDYDEEEEPFGMVGSENDYDEDEEDEESQEKGGKMSVLSQIAALARVALN